MTEGYRRYWGHCDRDNVLIQVESGPDDPHTPLPDPTDWYAGLRCPICGSPVPGGYEGADNVPLRRT